MGRPARLTVVALVLAATVAAQRSPFFATVIGPDGQPVADAVVNCVFTPDIVTPWASDIVVATTDERGRARCDLITGRLYVAWAIGPEDAAGVHHVTEPTRLVAAGRVMELRALHRRPPQRVKLTGHEPWREVGAVGLRWFPVASQDLHHNLPLPRGAVIDLPAAPWSNGCLALTDAVGEIMVTTKVEPEMRSLPEFAHPIVVVAKVTDSDFTPLAGATLKYRLARHGELWALLRSGFGKRTFDRVVGTTAADGTLRFHAPKPPSSLIDDKVHQHMLLVFAGMDGFEPQPHAVADAGTIAFKLQPATTTTIRLLGAEGDGVEMAAFGGFQLPKASGQHQLRVERTSPAKWLVHAADSGFILRVSLPAKLPTAVVADWIIQPPPELTLYLGALSRVKVRVLDAAGGPVACALGVANASRGVPIRWDAILASDVGGGAELRLSAGDFYIYATTGTAHAVALVDTEETEPLTLRLEQLPTMRVRVLDVEGKPVAGARAVGHGCANTGTSLDSPHAPSTRRIEFGSWIAASRFRLPPHRAHTSTSIRNTSSAAIESMRVLSLQVPAQRGRRTAGPVLPRPEYDILAYDRHAERRVRDEVGGKIVIGVARVNAGRARDRDADDEDRLIQLASQESER